MKKYIIIILVILLAGVLFFFVFNNKPIVPIKYQATEMSKTWLTYTNNDYGFHIKYPADWSIAQSNLNGVFFMPEDGTPHFSIFAEKTSIDPKTLVRESVTGQCSVDNTPISINNLEVVRKIVCEEGAMGVKGTERVSYLYLQKDDITYKFIFGFGFGEFKNSTALQSQYDEVMGTFGFNPIVKSDKLTYVDPTLEYSFTYPASWNLTSNSVDTTIITYYVGGMTEDQIAIRISKNTNFEQYKQSQGDQLENCTARKEYFANKIIGQKCDWLSKETYVFEKSGNIYAVTIQGVASGRETIDSILNTLTI